MLDASDGQHKITGLHFAGSNSLNPLTTFGVGCKISNVLTEMSSSEWNGRIQVNKSAISGSGDYVKVNNKCYKLSGFSNTLETTHNPDAAQQFQAYLSEIECANG